MIEAIHNKDNNNEKEEDEKENILLLNNRKPLKSSKTQPEKNRNSNISLHNGEQKKYIK